MKIMLVVGALIVVTAGALQLPWPVGPVHAATLSIGVSGFNFDPADRTIATGDTIEWSWSTSPDEHNVIFVGESDTSGAPAVSDTYSRTFNSAGTFEYYCEVHGTPGGGGMAGTITVQAAATNTPGQATSTRTATRTATRTPTVTPDATTTLTPQVTTTVIATNTPVPAVTNVPTVVPTVSGGGTGGAVTAPDTGAGGRSGGSAPWWMSVALASAGVVMIAGAAVVRRRTG